LLPGRDEEQAVKYKAVLRQSAVRISVDLSEEQAERLRSAAERLGVQPEDLAQAAVADLLRPPEGNFERVAEHVLRKNEELYRRLAL
jgi:hypothetical protein